MKFSTKSIDNATLRQNVNGRQGLLRGAKGSKPEMLKPFADNYVKKKKDMEGKPKTFSSKETATNEYLARNKDLAGKKTSAEFRGDKPRFNPMEQTQELVGSNSSSSGTFRGGRDKKEVNNRYEKPAGRATGKSVNPFAIKIKSSVNL
tara:strand:- start:319 stop:762 length:444 start_codon:yes stop_codon:yes gene_type:complete